MTRGKEVRDPDKHLLDYKIVLGSNQYSQRQYSQRHMFRERDNRIVGPSRLGGRRLQSYSGIGGVHELPRNWTFLGLDIDGERRTGKSVLPVTGAK